jgi:hypothetical protein
MLRIQPPSSRWSVEQSPTVIQGNGEMSLEGGPWPVVEVVETKLAKSK